ncbi:YodC family protein [Paraburkholderia sp. Tr-20389]|uniref:YodC family protein n=1 Tax=Paraburkholderia sp. Tr-20389 TaxID=2703903 RepID=UPI00197E21D8|nr:YodC family protein [Paraburkholderia sp. Tr-20389]MBN3754826.1 YodC family protein [Paraburkholderia sp. Tr-20389]
MLTATFDAFEATQQAVQINVGDVVTLKAGGSRMTVTYAGPIARKTGEWLVCQWFDDHGELRQETFAPEEVRLQPRSIPAGSVQLRKFVRIVSP